jgi:hypothetical protein
MVGFVGFYGKAIAFGITAVVERQTITFAFNQKYHDSVRSNAVLCAISYPFLNSAIADHLS